MARQQPDQETFMSLSQEGYDSIPIYREKLLDRLTPISLFESFRDCKPVILLESAERGEVWRRFSFLIIDPEEEIRISFKDNLIGSLEEKYPQQCIYPQPEIPFLGGAVGFLSYDAVKTWEKTVPQKPLDYPYAYFLTVHRFLYIDHLRHTVGAVQVVPAGKRELYLQAKTWMDDIFNSLEKKGDNVNTSFQLKGVIQSNFSQNGF